MFGYVIKADFLAELVVLTGLITVQFVFSVYGILLSYVMSLGIASLFLVVYSNFATAFFLFPLAVCFESKRWPKKFSWKLFGQFVLISIGGVTLYQVLMLNGMKKTSPAVAAAMPNVAPGLIFVIAWALRFEKVNLKCIYSKVKMLGTLVCIVGAITMSLLHSPATITTLESSTTIDNDKIVGTLCIMAAVIVLSCNVVLQAATLGGFPAPLSLSAITSFIAAIFTGLVYFAQEHRLWVDSQLVSAKILLGIVILAGLVGGACTSFNTWAMKRKGPVFISMFNPVGTVMSVVLSALTLNDPVTLGSIFGMILMFGGLYFVLWAKKKEDILVIKDDEEQIIAYDSGKPLLS